MIINFSRNSSHIQVSLVLPRTISTRVIFWSRMGWRRLVTRAERILSGLSFLGIPELHAVLGDALVEFFHSRRSSGRMWLMVVFPWDVARLPVKHVFRRRLSTSRMA